MTYETIDWPTEAQRVARAFGIEEECEFHEHAYTSTIRTLKNPENGDRHFELINKRQFAVSYDSVGRHYYLGNELNENWESVQIGWQGGCIGRDMPLSYPYEWSRALFHLDLLTPEVEAALGVSICAHQKMEWVLEYEGRVVNGI